MATTNNANLFGEDTDSSDESVGGGGNGPSAAAGATKEGDMQPTRRKIGDDDDDEVEEPPNKKESETKDDDDDNNPTVLEDKAGGGDDDKIKEGDTHQAEDNKDKIVNKAPSTNEDEEEGKAKSKTDDDAPTSKKNNNSALFGDDDDDEDTEDDEFDGNDDGIVGKSGEGVKNKVVKPKDSNVGLTMNQRMGLDSDGDEDIEGNRLEGGDKEDEDANKKPMYVPPRKMELLDLSESGIKGSAADDDDAAANKNPEQQPIYHIVKLPNLVGINPHAYNRETHDRDKEEEEYRGYVHNMIRWRYKTDDDGEVVRDEHGNPIRESNTRLVKWSDGSYTLHVGTEVLEMDNLDSSIPMDHPDESLAGFAGNNGYLYVSQKAKTIPPTKKELERGPPKDSDDEMNMMEEDDDDDEEKLEAKNAGTVLECIAPITSRLAPRPLSLTSDAHRNLTLAVRQRNVKRARIAEIVTDVDPEKEKLARIKGKDDLAKSRARSSSGARRSTAGSARRGRMNESFLEDGEEEDYDGVNLSRLKKRTMQRRGESSEEEMDYGDDSEDDEEEWLAEKKRKRGAAAAKDVGKKEDESESEGEVVFGSSESEGEDVVGKKRSAGGSAAKKPVPVFGDSDDDE